MQMNRRTLMWGVIAILFIITLFVSFKTGSGSAAVSTATQTATAAKSASSAMVGGC